MSVRKAIFGTRDTIMHEPVVWIISAEQWPRALLRAELIEAGFDACGYLNITEALRELEHLPQQRPRAIVLDLTELEFTRPQLAALGGENIPTVTLGGASELSDARLGEFAWAGIFRRPFMLREVVALIVRLAGGTT